MSARTTDIILEQLKSLTLLEAAELVKQIETAFGVDASPKAMLPRLQEEDLVPVASEPTEFDVVLEAVPGDRIIAVLKVVRSLTGLGLKETKELVDSAPRTIREGVNLETAEDIKQQLEAVGATVVLNGLET